MSMPGRSAPRLAPERKVGWAAAGAYVGLASLLYGIELVGSDPVIVTPLPDVLEPLVLALLPSVASLVLGYLTKHTPRPDLPAAER
jgi:hypothetical protein